MKISILIAAYRAGPFVQTALGSVAKQTHHDWELVVVEDGSHDETEGIVRKFAFEHPTRSVRYENHGSNRGVAATRNRLIAMAQGDAVAFLDADDRWNPDHLALGARGALTAPYGAVVGGLGKGYVHRQVAGGLQVLGQDANHVQMQPQPGRGR